MKKMKIRKKEKSSEGRPRKKHKILTVLCSLFLIGGIVRDLILKNEIKDIDIVVQDDAIKFAYILKENCDCEIIKEQSDLRTVCIKFNPNILIDFASTREEMYTSPGILPKAYNYGCNINLDMKRRDFTINTMAMALSDSEKYKLIDYYNGFEDIQMRKIKVLHKNSFIDDPSRIVRAWKFKLRLNFEIDQNTFKLAMDYLKNPCKNIPLERIKGEFLQYFSIKNQNIYNEVIDNKLYKLISDNPIKKIENSRLREITKYNKYYDNNLIFILCLIINSDYSLHHLNLTAFEKKVIYEVRELMKSPTINTNDNFEIYQRYIKNTDLTLYIYYLISADQSILKFLDSLKQIKILITGKNLIDLGLIPSKNFTLIFNEVLKEKLYGNINTMEEEIEFVKKYFVN